MSIFDSIKRNIKNVFGGSDKGEDINEWFRESIPLTEYPPYSSDYKSPLPPNPPNPNVYPTAPKPEWGDIPRPEEEVADWFSDKNNKKENPDESDVIEEEKTIHQKMYEIATARYNPFSLGGSENCDSDITCNLGGSEEAHK